MNKLGVTHAQLNAIIDHSTYDLNGVWHYQRGDYACLIDDLNVGNQFSEVGTVILINSDDLQRFADHLNAIDQQPAAKSALSGVPVGDEVLERESIELITVEIGSCGRVNSRYIDTVITVDDKAQSARMCVATDERLRGLLPSKAMFDSSGRLFATFYYNKQLLDAHNRRPLGDSMPHVITIEHSLDATLSYPAEATVFIDNQLVDDKMVHIIIFGSDQLKYLAVDRK